MVRLTDIHSLTDFQRHTRRHIARMKKTGRPTVLTVNGQAELVVLDAESYEKLLDEIERSEANAGIRRGLASMKRGEGRPAMEALEELRKKFHIPERR